MLGRSVRFDVRRNATLRIGQRWLLLVFLNVATPGFRETTGCQSPPEP